MVADIAGVYGVEAHVTREQMIYCLFRHTAAQAVRDLAVRVGERVLVQQVSVGALQTIAQHVGVHLTRAAIGKGLGVPAKSVSAEEAPTYLGAMAHFAQVNNPTSSARTRALLKWEPTHPGLLVDIAEGHYFADAAK